ncbi:hypothetical protein B0T21DRAFT_432767 [Apiosordaria backusii]|uniref:EF-hand domain-containing protein n=1 Tax=Apiosordaria backusii TaxID=314023 RepID=A0AA40ELS3_9PEZI|nr:hypothetical protein B0T21DRAFT_432767 [Apiosordaria backusii]
MHLPTLLLSTLPPLALAHGNHGGGGGGAGDSQKPAVDSNANWMTRHMAEEHHITTFDPPSFFTLHDFDSSGHLDASEILKLYGLLDPSNSHYTPTQRDQFARQILDLIDTNRDDLISKDEFLHFLLVEGKELPDLGTGPGHHGDDEYEYEIHHWEKYHDENTKLEDLTHPEDIEHFKKHEQMELEEEQRQERELKAKERAEKAGGEGRGGWVVEENIPRKFQRVDL